MAIYVKNNNDFEQSEPIVRECPHCGANAPLIPIATPGFAELSAARPQHAGVAFRCAACNEPRFARTAIRSFDKDRIVLSANLVEIERSKEHFPYNYLPAKLQRLIRETFGCYTADLFLAFAILCRRTLAVASSLETRPGQTSFAQRFEDAAILGEIDATTRECLREALFGSGPEPEISADQAAVLIEILKDILQQRYVRTAKLKRAIQMRQFFAAESPRRVAPLETLRERRDPTEH